MAYEFHYRFRENGGCDVICTRCFQIVGSAVGSENLQAVTAAHVCEQAAQESPLATAAAPGKRGARRLIAQWESMAIPMPHALAMIVLLFYIVPTVLEVQVAGFGSLSAACLLIGDLAGCLAIFFILKQKRTAVALYISLTAAEGVLYSMRVLPMQSLVWMMDLVPTLFLLARIPQMKSAAAVRRRS